MKNMVLLLFSLLLLSCGSDDSIDKKEVELKPNEESSQNVKSIAIKKDRKLRYVYSSNGGIIGYFDDGTVSGCPRCDFEEENIKALQNIDPHATYTIIDGGLLVNGEEIKFDLSDSSWSRWHMIDYKWR